MKEVFIEAFVEGFKGPIRLLFDLMTAVGKAVATVHSDLMNQTSRTEGKKASD